MNAMHTISGEYHMINHAPDNVGRLCRFVFVVGVLLLTAAFANAANPPQRDVDLIRKKACASLQQDYDQLAKKYSADPAFQNFQRRLTLITSTASAVLRDLAAHKAAFFNQSLATISPSKGQEVAAIGAAKILTTCQDAQNIPLALPEDQVDAASLQTYYSAYLAGLNQTINARAQSAVRPEVANEVVRLLLIVPMLDRADENWHGSDIASLPTLVKNPKYIRSAEEYALQARHLRLAYLLSRFSKSTTAPADVDPQAFLAYLKTSTDLMFRDKDYAAGQYCLESAIATAKAVGDQSAYADLRIRLTDVKAALGQHDQAAEDLKAIMADTTDANLYGKAAMLRLKHLYDLPSPDYKVILAEATLYRKDSRCQPYLPQILYMGWVTCRRDPASEKDESSWRQEFQQRFPDNPLAADMYFASAMTALASSNYDQALRVLQFIEYRYPNSRLVPKVQEIKRRLEATSAQKPAQTSTTRPQS